MTAHPYPWDWLFIEATARHEFDSATDFVTLVSALARCGAIVPPGAGIEDVRRICAGLCDEQLTG